MKSEKRERPNKNYKLSHEKADEENIKYYYNRESRLEKAPQSVRDLYKVEKKKHFNIFRSLVDTRSKAMMFLSIVVLSFFIFMLNIMGYFDKDLELLGGNIVSVQAFEYEGFTYISIRKIIHESSNVYTGEVEVKVSPYPANYNIQDYPYKINFLSIEEQNFGFPVPFISKELLIKFQAKENSLELIVKSE